MTTHIGEERSERIFNINEKWVTRFEEKFDKINAPLLKKLSALEKKQYKEGHNVYLMGNDFIEWGIFKPFDYNSKTSKKGAKNEQPSESVNNG
jgi:hypothetical protein